MDIELTETKTYSFKLGDTLLHGFVIASEWNGMTELRRQGEKLIVHGMPSARPNGFAFMFDEIFGGGARKPGDPFAARIVSASPDLLALIAKAQKVAPASV